MLSQRQKCRDSDRNSDDRYRDRGKVRQRDRDVSLCEYMCNIVIEWNYGEVTG